MFAEEQVDVRMVEDEVARNDRKLYLVYGSGLNCSEVLEKRGVYLPLTRRGSMSIEYPSG